MSKKRKSFENSYEMFVDGKFNPKIPRDFNFAIMRRESKLNTARDYNPDITILK